MHLRTGREGSGVFLRCEQQGQRHQQREGLAGLLCELWTLPEGVRR